MADNPEISLSTDDANATDMAEPTLDKLLDQILRLGREASILEAKSRAIRAEIDKLVKRAQQIQGESESDQAN